MKAFSSLPGEDLIRQGLEDLSRGELSPAALLVSIGAQRLRDAGLPVPPALPDADHRLYRLLAQTHGDDAHSQYNGLLRTLVSFEQALECAKQPAGPGSWNSCAGWAAMALKSVDLSGLQFPHSAYDGTRAWFDEVTEGTYSRVGYVRKAGPKDSLSMTAIGVMCRIFMDKNKADARLSNGCDLRLRDKPRWEPKEIDFYYWYYGSLALFQFDGPGGPKWRAWNEDMKNVLVKNQNTQASGCRNGSWEPVDRWSRQGGRV